VEGLMSGHFHSNANGCCLHDHHAGNNPFFFIEKPRLPLSPTDNL
jgi:hypothetical protein